MALLGFTAVLVFLLSLRGVRNAIWLLLAYAWFRSDPLDALLWIGIVAVGMLAWSLLQAAADGQPGG